MDKDSKVTAGDLKSEVHDTFSRIYEALKNREKQMLRQIDVIWQQCQQTHSSNENNSLQHLGIKFENENKLCDEISKFGVLDLSDFTLDSNLYVIEDYICPKVDHECLYKCLDTLNMFNSTDDLNVQVEFPQCKKVNLSLIDNYASIAKGVDFQIGTNLNPLTPTSSPINLDGAFHTSSETNNASQNLLIADIIQTGDIAKECTEKLLSKPNDSPEILKEKNTKETKWKFVLNGSRDSSVPSSPSSNSLNKMTDMEHPMQVQHWLQQIITETEIEPVQNIEKQIVLS